MPKWEYKTDEGIIIGMLTKLNENGAEGWEIISLEGNAREGKWFAIFKRPLEEKLWTS